MPEPEKEPGWPSPAGLYTTCQAHILLALLREGTIPSRAYLLWHAHFHSVIDLLDHREICKPPKRAGQGGNERYWTGLPIAPGNFLLLSVVWGFNAITVSLIGVHCRTHEHIRCRAKSAPELLAERFWGEGSY